MIYRLEKGRGWLQILIHLFVHGPTCKTELSRTLRPSHESVVRSLEILEELSLVVVHPERDFPFRQVYELSPWGRQLVDSPVHRWPALFWEWSGVAGGAPSDESR